MEGPAEAILVSFSERQPLQEPEVSRSSSISVWSLEGKQTCSGIGVF